MVIEERNRMKELLDEYVSQFKGVQRMVLDDHKDKIIEEITK